MAELQNSFVQPSPKARRLLRQLWEILLGQARLPHHLSSHTVGFCNKQVSCLYHRDYEGHSEPRLHELMRFCLDPCVLKSWLQTLRDKHYILECLWSIQTRTKYQKIECEFPNRCEVQGCFWSSLASPHLRHITWHCLLWALYNLNIEGRIQKDITMLFYPRNATSLDSWVPLWSNVRSPVLPNCFLSPDPTMTSGQEAAANHSFLQLSRCSHQTAPSLNTQDAWLLYSGRKLSPLQVL